MPLLFSRISSRGVMLRHVASLWFLSRHGIWLDYRLILICWVMALNEHIWLFYFSLCVPVCVRAYTHIHTCVYVHMLARGSYIFVCVCVHVHACTHAYTWELHIHVCMCLCGKKISALDTAHQVEHTWNSPMWLTGRPVSTGNPSTTILGFLYVTSTVQTHVLMLA